MSTGINQKPRTDSTPSLTIDFRSYEDLVVFYEFLEDSGIFGELETGVREQDDLDGRNKIPLIVKSRADVEDHPGQLLPLPALEEGETLNDLRNRVGPVQREIIDVKLGASYAPE